MPESSRAARSVALTCDFLRFEPVADRYENFQVRNLVWMHEILAAAVDWRALGITVSLVHAPPDRTEFERALGNPEALAEYRRDPALAWARRYDIDEPDVFPGILQRLCEHDLVIGFELPPTLKRRLHARGCRYVSIAIHPLRFLRDLTFAITTNVPAVATRAVAETVPRREIDAQSHRFRALFRRRLPPACAVPSDVPLLIGQTEQDSVLIDRGRFARWSDHRDALAHALRGFDAVVFIEHPSRTNSGEILQHLRSAHGKTVVATTANGYGVLFQHDHFPGVVTLASSLGVEAAEIGHACRFLLDDPRRKFVVDGIDIGVPDALGHGILEAGFWSDVIAGISTTSLSGARVDVRDPFTLGDNFLRNSLDAWSFGAMQHGLTPLTSRKTVLPASELRPDRLARLLGDCVGSDRPMSPREAIQTAGGRGIHIGLLDAPIGIGESREIPLGGEAAAMHLTRGFLPPEPWGSWIGELAAELVLPIAPEAIERGAGLEIDIDLQVFEDLVARSPAVRVFADGRPVGYLFFRTASPRKQTLTLAMRPESPLVTIGFELSDLVSASEGGNSADGRLLGIGISRLAIRCTHPATVSDLPDGPMIWGVGATPPPARASGETA